MSVIFLPLGDGIAQVIEIRDAVDSILLAVGFIALGHGSRFDFRRIHLAPGARLRLDQFLPTSAAVLSVGKDVDVVELGFCLGIVGMAFRATDLPTILVEEIPDESFMARAGLLIRAEILGTLLVSIAGGHVS